MNGPPVNVLRAQVPARLVAACLLLAVCAAPGPVAAGEEAGDHADAHPPGHVHHAHAAPEPVRAGGPIVTRVRAPAVGVVGSDGRAALLTDVLDDGRPVLLNFIFTSCTTICPISSQSFVAVQDRLGAARDRIHLVSISIDPEFDTPQRLGEYAARFGAGRQWSFLTGKAADIVAIQSAFGSYRGDKMNHEPATFLRAAPGAAWIRFDGFTGADALLDELKRQASKAPPASG
jgi:protein SCO1/2